MRSAPQDDVMSTTSLRQVYDMWPQDARRLREVIATMSPAELAIRPALGRWPIWATVGHVAGVRIYWLCDVVGEPGAGETPFAGDAELGWEDELDRPRDAEELVAALDSTWRVIDRRLDRWTVGMLSDWSSSARTRAASSVTPGAVSCSACSRTRRITAGSCRRRSSCHGLPQIDLWASD